MVKHFQDDPDPPPFHQGAGRSSPVSGKGEAGATSLSKPSRWRLTRRQSLWQPPSSRIGETVSCAASHETCADIPGLPRNKRILHDTIF